MTGERMSQAGWLVPSSKRFERDVAEAEFTSSSGDVRASSVTREGTVRRETIRNRFQST